MTAAVEIIEVGPRDGLQNEKRIIATADKLRLIDKLAAANITRIETAACVSPKKIPQMADAAEILKGLPKINGICYSALVPNARGLQTALAADTIGEIAVFTGASETFVKNNINCTIGESIAIFTPLVATAKSRGLRVRAYLSTAIICPFEGKVMPQKAAAIAAQLYFMGCDEIAIADTIGGGKPEDVRHLLNALGEKMPLTAIAGHFHDTGGAALDNINCALECGISKIDAAVAGLGGCPFAPGAPGNVATEKVVRFLHRRGIQTGIDETKLALAGEYISALVGGV